MFYWDTSYAIIKFAILLTPSIVYRSKTPFLKIPQRPSDTKENENIIFTLGNVKQSGQLASITTRNVPHKTKTKQNVKWISVQLINTTRHLTFSEVLQNLKKTKLPQSHRLSITKTRLLKYIENFTSKNWKFSDEKLWYFSYFCSKHRLWVLVRTASPRRF